MVKNVEFFDWKLDQINPITSTFINYGKLYVSQMPDMHSALHIGIVLEGINCCRLGKDELSFPAGTFYLTAPWETHSTGAGDGARLLLITLDNRSLNEFFCSCSRELAALLRMTPALRMEHINRSEVISVLIEKIICSAEGQSSRRQQLRLWHAVLELFMEIIPENVENLPANDDYLRMLPVLEKLGSKMLTLSEAAKLCNLSICRFSTLFKEFSGLSFCKYERNFRLNGAQSAIRRGATLKEAAAAWDFCDKSHLARLLKNL
jgi:AraC-like DNA-binding protein